MAPRTHAGMLVKPRPLFGQAIEILDRARCPECRRMYDAKQAAETSHSHVVCIVRSATEACNNPSHMEEPFIA